MAWRDRQQSTTQKVSVLLDHLREGRYVLLLDGLEHLQDLKTFKLTDPDMETFFERALQQASTLQVLVTSRFPLALPLPLKSWERLIPLEQGLPTAYAVDLFRRGSLSVCYQLQIFARNFYDHSFEAFCPKLLIQNSRSLMTSSWESKTGLPSCLAIA